MTRSRVGVWLEGTRVGEGGWLCVTRLGAACCPCLWGQLSLRVIFSISSFLTKGCHLPLDRTNYSTLRGASGSLQPVKKRKKKEAHENSMPVVLN